MQCALLHLTSKTSHQLLCAFLYRSRLIRVFSIAVHYSTQFNTTESISSVQRTFLFLKYRLHIPSFCRL